MTAFFNMQLPPVALSLGASPFPIRRGIEHRSNRVAAMAVRAAAAGAELGLFLGMLLGVAVPLVVVAGFFM
jgi:hypothetical protein